MPRFVSRLLKIALPFKEEYTIISKICTEGGLHMELLILIVFSAILIICLMSGNSLILALLAGFILFFGYGLKTGHTVGEMVHLAVSGVKTTKNILITLALVGMQTAAWRISGTIPYIVYYASHWCDGSAVLLASFLLCALVSALTGTSFGTAATIGVICMTMASSMGIPPMYAGGAVMAGSYFGDRCSPMSTSALLVAAITKTDIFTNCRLMIKTGAVPCLLTCAVYAALGLLFQGSSSCSNAAEIFCRSFTLSWPALIPAILVIVLSALRIDVKGIMIASILSEPQSPQEYSIQLSAKSWQPVCGDFIQQTQNWPAYLPAAAQCPWPMS